jgi:hypothetical protein
MEVEEELERILCHLVVGETAHKCADDQLLLVRVEDVGL